jgi:hypothetical protein
MPSCISNCHVYATSIDPVRTALGQILKNEAYIVQAEANWVTVFPDAAQRPSDVAKRLSQSLDTGVIASGVDDDDCMYFALFEKGQKICSGERPAKPTNDSNRPRLAGSLDALAKYTFPQITTTALREALGGPHYTAIERLESFAKLLGIDPSCAITGFRYIQSEISDIEETTILIAGRNH